MDRSFTLSQALQLATVVSGVVVAIASFFFARAVKKIREEGFEYLRNQFWIAIWENSAAAFTKILDRSRDHLTRICLSKDRSICFFGQHPDRDQIDRLLRSLGFSPFVNQAPASSDVVVILGVDACKQALTEEWSAGRCLVLYTGTARLDAATQEALQVRSLIAIANMPATAAAHVAMLAQVRALRESVLARLDAAAKGGEDGAKV